jgi:hypothetical protein
VKREGNKKKNLHLLMFIKGNTRKVNQKKLKILKKRKEQSKGTEL